MSQQELLNEVLSLSPEGQRQVADFIAVLKKEKQPIASSKLKAAAADDPFIGMWKDRQDLDDSSAWVRNLRRGEW